MTGVVDQLNVGALHSTEVLCRRIAAIVEAYVVTGRPSWEHARFYAGTASAEEVVAPALRNQVLRRVKEENELTTARSRGLLRGAPSDRAEDDAAGGGGGKSGRGAGRGRGKGGRGDQPPTDG